MIFWITALIVWLAAGARVGRVLVRPATTVRVAIVFAVAFVAAAATVSIPDVADTIDRVDGGPGKGADLAALLALSAWIGFTTATSVIAAAAWPVTSRKSLRLTAAVVYGIGAVSIGINFVSAAFGWIAVTVGCVFIVITGLRNFDWTPLGRGIGIFTTGTAGIGVLAAVGAGRELANDGAVHRLAPSWAWSLVSLLISVGAVWILVEVWIRARLLLRRVDTLHKVLVQRFPEVTDDDPDRTTTVLRASDHVAHIMDALYLQAGAGGLDPNLASPPPPDTPVRARAVAQWVRQPMYEKPLDIRWIAPPEGLSTRRWVGAIARAYRSV